MNIKEIVDKIPKEADVSPAEYAVADRLVDVNHEYLALIEEAMQIGSIEPISGAEDTSEEFVVVAGSNVFTRTIEDVPLFSVHYRPNADAKWEVVYSDPTRTINGLCYCDMKFFADEKRVFVENGQAGTLLVTYAHGGITVFDQADYDNVTPPDPTWLPEVFRPLLWLKLALRQAHFYKTDRVAGLEAEYTRLKQLFRNHYLRNAELNQRFKTEKGSGVWGDSNNYR